MSAAGGLLGSERLAGWQRRVLVIGWITYAGYYLGRVNLATAIPALREDLALSAQATGLLATGFFFAYALGQLLSGHLGDRLSPRRLVFVGLLGSAVLNLLVAGQSGWLPLLLLWSVNGLFQASGWAPIVRLLANWYPPERRRGIAGVVASSFVAGNALTWLLTGWLVAVLDWRAAFWLPALLMGLLALGWGLWVRDSPAAVGLEPRAAEAAPAGRPAPLGALLLRHWLLAAASLCGGFLLFSLVVWTPAALVDLRGLGVGAAGALAALLPVAGLFGTLGVGGLLARRSEIAAAQGAAAQGVAAPSMAAPGAAALGALLFLALTALTPFFPAATTTLWGSALLLMLLGALAYGVATVVLSALPLLLAARHETAGVAAVIDFAFNLGAGLGGLAVGAVLDRLDWQAVFVVLALAALLGGAALLAFGRQQRGGEAVYDILA